MYSKDKMLLGRIKLRFDQIINFKRLSTLNVAK